VKPDQTVVVPSVLEKSLKLYKAQLQKKEVVPREGLKGKDQSERQEAA
jgi:hypothetical protein